MAMGRKTRWVRPAVQVFRACIGLPTEPGISHKYQEKKRKKRSFRLWLFRRRGKGGSTTSLPRLPSRLSGSDTTISLDESRDVAGGASIGIPKAVSHSLPHAMTSPATSLGRTSADDCYKHLDKCSTVPHMKEGSMPSTDRCHGQECVGTSTLVKQTESTLSDGNELSFLGPTSSEAHTEDRSHAASATSTERHIEDQRYAASTTSTERHIEDQSNAVSTTSPERHIEDQSHAASTTSTERHIEDQSHVASLKSIHSHIQDQSQVATGTHTKDEDQVASATQTDIHMKDTDSHGQIRIPKALTTTSDEQKSDAMPDDKSRKLQTSSSLTLHSLQGCSTTFGAPFHGSASGYKNQCKLSEDQFCGSNVEHRDVRGATAPKRMINVKFKDKVKVKVMKVGTSHIQNVQKLRNFDSVSTQPDQASRSPITADVSLKQNGINTGVERRPALSSSFVYLSDAASEYLRYERSYNEQSVHRSESPVSDVSDLPFDLEEKHRKEEEHMYHPAHPSARSLVEPKAQSTEPDTDTTFSASSEHQVEHSLSVQASRGFDIEVPPKDNPRYQEQMNPYKGSIMLSSKYESANEEDGQSMNLHSYLMHQDQAASNRLKSRIQKQASTIHHESTVSHNATVCVRETCLHKEMSRDKVSGNFPSTCDTSAQRYGGDLKEEPQTVKDLTKEEQNTEEGTLEKVLESTYYSSALEWADQCYELGKDETQQLLYDIYGRDYLTRNISLKSPVSTKEILETTQQSSYFSSALEWADQCYQIGKDETQQLLLDIYGKDYLTVGIPQKPETKQHHSLDNSMRCTTSECRNHGSMLGKVDTHQPLQEVHGVDPTKGKIQGHEQSTLDGMPSCLSCSWGQDSALFRASALQWRNQDSKIKTEETRRLLRTVYSHDHLKETLSTQAQTKNWTKETEELEAAARNVNPSHPVSSCNNRKIRFTQKIVENRKQSALCCGPKESGLSMQGHMLSRQKGTVSCNHALSRKQVLPSPVRWSSRPKVRWSERKRQTLQEFSDELDYLEGLDSRRIGGDESFY